MKKTYKKLIALLVIAVCLMPFSSFAQDEEISSDGLEIIGLEETETAEEISENKIPEEIKKQAGMLDALGILPESVDFEAEITREETAVVLVKMLAKEEAARSASNYSYYTDVSVYSDSVGYINVATNEGLISGRSENIFDPKAPITYSELSKLLVSATGYSTYAERKGGFPAGFLSVASQLKMLKDVNLTGKTTVSWADAIVMVYNAMQVDILSGSVFAPNGELLELEKIQGENILSVNHKLFEAKGQITGTAVCKMFGRGLDRDLKAGEIEIGGYLYSYDVEKLSHLEGLTGYRVDYLYREGKDAEYELVYAYVNDSSMISVMSYDITEVYGFGSGEAGGAYLEYFIDDGTMDDFEKLELQKKLALIVNNVSSPRVTNEILKPECGKVTLIDSDDDEVYDVAKVVQYEMKIVDTVSIYDKHIYFKNDPTTTPLVLNPVYGDVSFTLTQDGEKISLHDLFEGDILGLVKSTKDNAPYYQIEKLSSAIEGTIEQISSEEVIIDGKKYGVSPTFDWTMYDVKPGDFCKLYFDFADELFYAENEEKMVPFEYVLVGVGTKRGARNTFSVKLVYTPDTRNKKLQIYDLAEKVKINDKKYEGKAALDALKLNAEDARVIGNEYLQPLRYVKFDEEGKIKMIETVEDGVTSTKENRTYRGTGPYNEAFSDIPISYETHIYYIPQSMLDEDWYFSEYNKLKFGTSHMTVMWGGEPGNPDNPPEAVFLWHNRTNSDPSFNINYERPMLVSDVKKVYNASNMEEQYRVSTFNSGGSFTYPSDLRNTNTACFENIKQGDIIFAALSSETEQELTKVQTIVGGDMWSCDKLLSLSDPSLYYYTLTEHCFGRVETIRSKPRENKCDVQLYVGESEFKTVSLTGVPIYYYDLAEKEISMGTYAAIKSVEAYGEMNASRMFIYYDETDTDDNGQFKPIMAVIVNK